MPASTPAVPATASSDASSDATTSTRQRLTFSFDSSGWLYLYHLGVAYYIQKKLLPHLPDDRLAFSGSSGGALVACALCTKMSIADLAVHVVDTQPECKYNPWRMLPCAEAAMTRFLPDDAAEQAQGRLRVLLTRVQLTWMGFPLVWPEAVSSFCSKAKLMQVLRATCHIPILGGLLPFRIDPDGKEADGAASDRHEGGGYYDGLFWPSVLYTWRAFHASDTLIKVSGLGWPTAHIAMQIPVPPHWVVLPPSQRMLWRLFASGYHDAARFWHERHGHNTDSSRTREQRCGPLPPEALAEPSRLYTLALLVLGWWQMLLLTLLFPLLPVGLVVAQLLRYPLTSARSVLDLLRQGMALALLVAVWPLVFVGVVVRWWLMTPVMARAALGAAVDLGGL